jgi:hypothetical protein
MIYIDTERQLVDIFTKSFDASRFTALRGGGLVFTIPMAWLERKFVSILYICTFCFSLAFSLYSPKSLCFTCYTSLYFVDYARVNRNEM